MTSPYFVTTAIPFVNGAPHLGHALELILADVLARHHRRHGRDVRFQTGTDEHSLKSVRAAEAANIPVTRLVEDHARLFQALKAPLNLTYDDFIRTSADIRHRPGVEKFWRVIDARGDIYQKAYRGLYCVGCEQFYRPTELTDGLCPEHRTPPEPIEETNDFFRLSRYAEPLYRLIETDVLQVEPESHKAALLRFIRSGLEDFSISRSQTRARGWGIPVPGATDRVVYVWLDALANYITAPGYADEGLLYQRYWASADPSSERIHVIGRGVTRFHGLYWPALLLSAGLPLPTRLYVHSYLTINGQKIGKSLGNAIDPAGLINTYGTDVVRYVLLRHIRTTDDGDFSEARLRQARNSELADQLGNLVRRTLSLIVKHTGGRIPERGELATDEVALLESARGLDAVVHDALTRFRPHEALDSLWTWLADANRYVTHQAPWTLIRSTDRRLRARVPVVLFTLADGLARFAHSLSAFLPNTALQISSQLNAEGGRIFPGAPVTVGEVLFPKIG